MVAGKDRFLSRPMRRLRRWVVAPQKEIERWRRRWRTLPLVILPKFLAECRDLFNLLLELRPDIVLGNARSGAPYVQTLEPLLLRVGMEVRYERLCSAWGHKLCFALKPAASIAWIHQALAFRKRIVMVDVSRKPFSDAQRIVGGVIVWLYNEGVAPLRGEPQPFELVPSLDKTMRQRLRQMPELKEALKAVREALEKLDLPLPPPFARHLLARGFQGFTWDEGKGCLLPINASRQAWIDDRTDKYAWLPCLVRWLFPFFLRRPWGKDRPLLSLFWSAPSMTGRGGEVLCAASNGGKAEYGGSPGGRVCRR